MSIKYDAVLPSSLLDKRQPIDMNFKKRVNENMTLKVGAVLEVVELDDPKNQSGLAPEYNVMVIEDDNTSIYKNCIAVDMFGGQADYHRKKYRVPKDAKKVRESGSLKNQTGSIVLILCLEGSAEQGVILGGLMHPQKGAVLEKELGHHMEGEFNGLNWKVDKDGALTITFKSATDGEGKPQDEEAGGSTAKIDKTGSLELNTNLEGADATSFKLDKTTKDIGAVAGNNITMTAQKDIAAEAKANVNVKAGADLLAEATGSAKHMSGGTFDIEAGGALGIKAPMMKVAADSQIELKTNVLNLKGQTTIVGPSVGTPALVFSTQFLGIGNLGIPVISQAIGPFSSSVFIAN